MGILEGIEHVLCKLANEESPKNSFNVEFLLNSKSNLLHDSEIISPVVVIPIEEHEIKNLDTVDYTVKIIAINNGKILRPYTISISELENSNYLHKRWGYVNVEHLDDKQIKFIYEAANQMTPFMKQIIVYNFTGWNPEDYSEFILGNLKVTSHEVITVQNKMLNNVPYSNITKQEACEFIKNNYFGITNNPIYSQIFMVYTIFSLIKSRMEYEIKESINFGLFISATSGTGKSVLINTLANPWHTKAFSYEDTEAVLIQAA